MPHWPGRDVLSLVQTQISQPYHRESKNINWKKVSLEKLMQRVSLKEEKGWVWHRESNIGNVANSAIEGQSHGQDQETKRAVMEEKQ